MPHPPIPAGESRDERGDGRTPRLRYAVRAMFERAPVAELAASGDLVLAALLVAVVVMMIVPLPPTVLDCLIALNISASLGLLLVALYVSDASRIAALPSLLLIATMFRLGLTVSTTRLVLLNGEAGRIVGAFGRIVVGGNVVVGGVVFLVLALVQFIVVAKGSERVAEVAARFTLDALPGKQMSIDADLRSGSMTLEEAQHRRRGLERESQLYGALDGAMKFVKGDAIASLVVVAINIIGGLAVGVFQRGMPIGAAISHYTVLTVGDGLAAQLPSLFVSTTAGLVVTRVPGDDASASLGADIAAQVGGQPRALLLTAGLLGLLACLPGLPAFPFVVLGGLAALVGIRQRSSSAPAPRPAGGFAAIDAASLTLRHATPIRLELPRRVREHLDKRAIANLRTKLFAELGLRVPPIELDDVAGDESRFAIASSGAVVASAVLPLETHWIVATSDELRLLGVEAVHRQAPYLERVLGWSDARAAERAAAAGHRTGDHAAFVLEHLELALRSNASEFVGVQEVRDLVDALDATHPALVAEVTPRHLSLAQVADVLRRLAHEGVSIGDLRGIFEALAVAAMHERDPVALTEHVRASLRRALTAAVTAGRSAVPVYLLTSDVEDAYREATHFASSGSALPIDPRVVGLVLEQLSSLELIPRDASSLRPILVVPQDIRRSVRATIENQMPRLAVYSPQDLAPSVVLQHIATVGVTSAGDRV